MALVTCFSCGKPVSDVAPKCPACACPWPGRHDVHKSDSALARRYLSWRANDILQRIAATCNYRPSSFTYDEVKVILLDNYQFTVKCPECNANLMGTLSSFEFVEMPRNCSQCGFTGIPCSWLGCKYTCSSIGVSEDGKIVPTCGNHRFQLCKTCGHFLNNESMTEHEGSVLCWHMKRLATQLGTYDRELQLRNMMLDIDERKCLEKYPAQYKQEEWASKRAALRTP
jgi:hypothetical protein